ncbi:sensor histidine kinase [Nitrosophilus kaiyonis]|uniref:sensor histidine kinase n=1 Tax=Nitrosophilus kaiyonis TaxID=2930200 RepID=UPI002492C59E|nr:HAMP domain-containing sensor histidine kinase [Nitrosophilus kaiyonis]
MLASAALIAIFSTFLYSYIKHSLYQELEDGLVRQAKYIVTTIPDQHAGTKIDSFYLKNTLDINVKIIPKPSNINNVFFTVVKKGREYFAILYYPYNFQEQTFLKIEKNISSVTHLLHKIYRIILFANILGFALIIIYAFLLSKMLTTYITSFTKKLADMNENMLKPIKIENLPEEFQPLGRSINMLINRIQTFVKYQKELFIGVAHELKTPLAVMKLKNEVTLIKKREPQEYIETIKLNIKTINEMNKMIENVLKIGRQEGDHFEPPVQMDVIAFLKEKANNYKLLAEQENKELIIDLKPDKYKTTIQPTLVNHILQNFIQNAIKFTPVGGKIILKSRPIEDGLKIEVIDEGPGIDEKMDLFAPFKRSGEKSGVGLGLFLAKSAADAMGATISIKNRKDRKGAVATLIIPSTLACPIC